MSVLERGRRAVQAALLLSPALLAGCYVVPIGYGPYPVYRPYDPQRYYRPPPQRYHRGWHGEAPAPQSFAAASGSEAAAEAGSFAAHIEASSIER